MKILDSSYCADFLRGREYAKQYRLEHQNETLVPPAIGFCEVYHNAIKVGRAPKRVEQNLPWVDRLDCEPEHGLKGARIRYELEQDGNRLRHPDMMIGGVARPFGVRVVTSDDGFEQIEGIEVENPREMYE